MQAFSLLFGIASAVHLSKETILNYSNWADLVMEPGTTWFVNVYKESCGHCIQNRPIWQQFIEEESVAGINYGALDCDKSPQICEKYPKEHCPGSLFFFTEDDGTHSYWECPYDVSESDFSVDQLANCQAMVL